MDVRFLKEISEAYVMDTELDAFPEQIYNELYDITKYIQKNDVELYNELYESSRITQQKILKTYLDHIFELNIIPEEEVDQELINEIEPITAAIGGLGLILTYLYRKGLTKGIMKIAAGAGKIFQNIGSFLINKGKYMQLRYSIIQENYKKCYLKCGVEKPSDISALSYTSISSSSTLTSKQASNQAECLRECYLDSLIEVICLHMEGYFACLKRTGNSAALQNAETDDIIKMISSTNIATSCSDYYNLAKEAIGNFYKILDLVYNDMNDDDKKLEWMNKFRSKLFQTRGQVQKYNNNQLQKYEFSGNVKPEFKGKRPDFRRN